MRQGNSPIQVLAVDDHPLMREGIRTVLDDEPDIVVSAEAATGREAVDVFLAQRPDVTLMDLQMPEMSGMDAILAIRQACPDARLIVLTTYSGDVRALRAIKAGALGYLLKKAVRQELAKAIRTVHQGKRYIPADVLAMLAEHVGDEVLTSREIEVLRNVALGSANKIIAANLGVSEDTIKAHVTRILTKLCAKDRTHAVAIAMKRGYLNPG